MDLPVAGKSRYSFPIFVGCLVEMKLKRWAALAAMSMTALCAAAENLTLGVLPAADSIVLDVAVEEGLFAKEGLTVKTVPFKSALEIGAAMRAGRLDGHFGDLMNVFTQNATGVPQTIVVTTTHTSPAQRAFGLVVAPKKAGEIKSLKDLNGTPTAMSAATIIDYLLDRMKATEKLPDDALKNTEIRQIPIRLQMLLTGQVETALLPEPLVTVVEQKGGRVIWDDTRLNEALAVVALTKKTATPETVTAFRKAVASAAALIEKDPAKYRALMVTKKLLPPPVAPGYKMVRLSLFDRADGLPPPPTEEDEKRVGDWMKAKGMIESVPTYADVVAP